MPKKFSSSAAAPKKVASFANPIFDKSLGQHILNNPLVAKSIIEKANIQSSDVVLEIGPGTGNLTVKLLERAKRVIAVEKDPRMAAELLKRVQGTPLQAKLHVMVGDFLKADLPYFDICVSNTPYQISSPLVFKLLSASGGNFRHAILMFQREFALRLVAQPGNPLYCRLSANVQLMSRVSHIMKISRNSFRPPPKVDSSVVRLEPLHPRPAIPLEEFDGLTRILFLRKNKLISSNFKTPTILAALERTFRADSSLLGRPRDQVEAVVKDFKAHVMACLESSGLAAHRASKLSLVEMQDLLGAFNERGIHFSASSIQEAVGGKDPANDDDTADEMSVDE